MNEMSNFCALFTFSASMKTFIFFFWKSAMSQRRSGSAPSRPRAKRARESSKSPSGKKTPSPKQKKKELTPGDVGKKAVDPGSGRKSTGPRRVRENNDKEEVEHQASLKALRLSSLVHEMLHDGVDWNPVEEANARSVRVTEEGNVYCGEVKLELPDDVKSMPDDVKRLYGIGHPIPVLNADSEEVAYWIQATKKGEYIKANGMDLFESTTTFRKFLKEVRDSDHKFRKKVGRLLADSPVVTFPMHFKKGLPHVTVRTPGKRPQKHVYFEPASPQLRSKTNVPTYEWEERHFVLDRITGYSDEEEEEKEGKVAKPRTKKSKN